MCSWLRTEYPSCRNVVSCAELYENLERFEFVHRGCALCFDGPSSIFGSELNPHGASSFGRLVVASKADHRIVSLLRGGVVGNAVTQSARYIILHDEGEDIKT